MTTISNIVIIGLLLWGGYSAWKAAFSEVPRAPIAAKGAPNTEARRGWFSTAPVARKTVALRPDSTILIYGPEKHRSTKIAEEVLRIRGFSQSVVIPVENIDQFHELGITEALKTAGLVDAKGGADMPFISVDGELYSVAALSEGLSQLPLTNVRERETPYIIIYGPANCPYTQQGREELDANSIPYEVRDVNDPRYQPHFEALVRAYDFKYINWPMLDINGRMFSKPSIEVVRTNYR